MGDHAELGRFSVTTEDTMPTYANGMLTIANAGSYNIAMQEGVAQTADRILITAPSGTVDLVLQSINIQSDALAQGLLSSSSSSTDVQITLVGSSSIVNTDTQSLYPEGMDIPGNLTIGGAGSLYVSASEGDQFDYGIYAAQSDGTTLTLRDSAQVQAGGIDPTTSPRYGITCMNLVVQDSATLSANGRQYGVFVLQGITLNGGAVSTTANGAALPTPAAAAVRPDNFFEEPAGSQFAAIPFSATALCTYATLSNGNSPLNAVSSAPSSINSFGITAIENATFNDGPVYGEGASIGILVLQGGLTANIVANGSVEGLATSVDGTGIAALSYIEHSAVSGVVLPDDGQIVQMKPSTFPSEEFYTIATPDATTPATQARIAIPEPDPPVPPDPPEPEPEPEPEPAPEPDPEPTPLPPATERPADASGLPASKTVATTMPNMGDNSFTAAGLFATAASLAGLLALAARLKR